eukprot:10032617-Ditylum_brightwellii.AAC.1
MLIQLVWTSAQIDYTAAFVNAVVEEEIYVDMPWGYKKEGHVLKLCRSLYGLKQSPRNFFHHLSDKLQKVGMTASKNNPCLFFTNKVICLVYVDNYLFFAPKQTDIDELLDRIRGEGMVFNIQNDAAGFLGVSIQRNEKNQTILLTQSGLIDRIIEALGLEDATGVESLTEVAPFRKDLFGEEGNAAFNYLSVIHMMLYLSSHSQLDIQYAVSQCACFSSNPKASHKAALKRIGRYLRETRGKGRLIVAAVEGLWTSKKPDDPDCTRSCTGFVITLCNCPIIWA